MQVGDAKVLVPVCSPRFLYAIRGSSSYARPQSLAPAPMPGSGHEEDAEDHPDVDIKMAARRFLDNRGDSERLPVLLPKQKLYTLEEARGPRAGVARRA